jgi:hypothetical protein
MSYIANSGRTFASKSAMLTDSTYGIYATLAAMGWTLYDNQDANNYRVYTTTGEAGDRIPEYLIINTATSGAIRFQACYAWNNSTHTGLGYWSLGSSTYGSIACAESANNTLYMAGDKNLVSITNNYGSTSWGFALWGHLPSRFWTTVTTLTASAAAGSNAVLTVASTSGFVLNNYYQILGASQEGRDRVRVTAIGSGTLTIASLPRNYSSGSQIGITPSTFGANQGTSGQFFPSSHHSSAGTGNSATYLSSSTVFGFSNTGTLENPDYYGQVYLGTPIFWAMDAGAGATNSGLYAYVNSRFFYLQNSTHTPLDTAEFNRNAAGTATGTQTSTTLQDTSKSWATNAFAGKAVILTGGTGAGQIAYIVSNTSDTLTISSTYNWITTPVSGNTTYSIVDQAYRFISGAAANGFWMPAISGSGFLQQEGVS